VINYLILNLAVKENDLYGRNIAFRQSIKIYKNEKVENEHEILDFVYMYTFRLTLNVKTNNMDPTGKTTRICFIIFPFNN